MGVGWNVSQQNKIIGTIFGFYGIFPNFEIHNCAVNLVVGKTHFVFSHMTAVTIFVGYGMTDLAFHFALVNFVHFHGGIGRNGIWVTAFTGLMNVGLIAAHHVPVCGVHFLCRVAFITIHVCFGVMYIRRVSLVFAHVFVLNTASVAGGAIGFHVRTFVKKMPVHKTTRYGVGAANVTLTTTGVAACTVISERLADLLHGFAIGCVHSGV